MVEAESPLKLLFMSAIHTRGTKFRYFLRALAALKAKFVGRTKA
jgi:hypothetical protein